MNSRVRLIVTFLVLCGGATGALAQPKSADVGATEADYGWWRDARFGIFIHWGPGAFVHKNSLAWDVPPDGRPPYRELGYMADVKDRDAVPPEITSGQYEQYQKPGKVPAAVYNHLYRLFDPVKFDAEEIAQMALEAGAGYVVFTTKHHDGFCMWDSAYTDYDMMSTPARRDICRELSEACHKRGLRVLWYYSKVDMHDARHDVKNPAKWTLKRRRPFTEWESQSCSARSAATSCSISTASTGRPSTAVVVRSTT